MGPWIWRKDQPALPWNHWALAVVWVHQSWLHHWRFEKSRHFLQPKPKQKWDWRSGYRLNPLSETQSPLGNWKDASSFLPVLSSADNIHHKIFLNLMVITLFFVKDPIFIWEVRLFQIKWLLKLIWDSSISTWTSFWLTVDAQKWSLH